MNISTSAKVHDFLSDIQSISPEQFDMIISIRDIFFGANKKLVEGIKLVAWRLMCQMR